MASFTLFLSPVFVLLFHLFGSSRGEVGGWRRGCGGREWVWWAGAGVGVGVVGECGKGETMQWNVVASTRKVGQ